MRNDLREVRDVFDSSFSNALPTMIWLHMSVFPCGTLSRSPTTGKNATARGITGRQADLHAGIVLSCASKCIKREMCRGRGGLATRRSRLFSGKAVR
jgi:hypothetical protein